MEYLFSIQSKAIFRKLLEALDIIGQQQYGHARDLEGLLGISK